MKRLMQIVVLASAGLWTQAHAALDYFLHIDGIPGESVDKGHKDWVDIDSFSWGVTNPGGKPAFMPYGWTQALDKSTPKVFVAVASGKHFDNVKMETVRTVGAPPGSFFTMSFDDVLFTSLQMSGHSESISVAGALVYNKLTMTYRPLKGDGSYGDPIVGSWDVSKGGAFSGNPDVLMGLFLAAPTGIGQIPVVPEPQTWALMGLGLVGLAVVRRRRAAAA
ncbi:MAG: type VI secretion system tube protein Hcp [Burkholderiaceae bacterium]|nr:type VI secretion system tube protein Hcp [Burkholderiaceae bacterium]